MTRGNDHMADEKYLVQAHDIVMGTPEVSGYAVFVFGSRASGRAHAASDLDIGIWGSQRAPASLLLAVEERLDQSDIPLKTEVVDFADVSPDFRNEALKQIIVWNWPEGLPQQ